MPSAWRIEGRPPPPVGARALAAYEDLLRARGAIDFDDLVVRACELLETDPRLRLRWQSRFVHVCVDEFQDVDAAQLRLVRPSQRRRTTCSSSATITRRSTPGASRMSTEQVHNAVSWARYVPCYGS